jgi:DNA polymerase elongation subunit (family B)
LLKELTAEEQDDKLIVTLTNTRDQNEFDEIKTDFLRFVNDRTGKSYQIELKIEKVAQKILKVYTNKDKFTYLAEQNPFLIEFSMELGLDLE